MKKIILSLISISFTIILFAQQPFRFWKDIEQFKTQDSIAFPATKQILFIGSSSFTNWQDVNDYFPGYHILNRAFGGSTLVDVMRYRYEVIYPYNPRQIVMYCGENDIASDKNITANTVTARFTALYKIIRDKYPTVPFAYISMKPSPSRMRLMPEMKKANQQIKSFLSKEKSAKYIDVYSLMLQKNGRPMSHIFLKDSLHMNKDGYAIWQKAIHPHLIKPVKK